MHKDKNKKMFNSVIYYLIYYKTVAKVVEGEFREICEQIGAKTELYLGIRQPPFPLMGV